jgi:hypothetical protein
MCYWDDVGGDCCTVQAAQPQWAPQNVCGPYVSTAENRSLRKFEAIQSEEGIIRDPILATRPSMNADKRKPFAQTLHPAAAHGDQGTQSSEQQQRASRLWNCEQRNVVASTGQFERRRGRVIKIADLKWLPSEIHRGAIYQTGKLARQRVRRVVEEDGEDVARASKIVGSTERQRRASEINRTRRSDDDLIVADTGPHSVDLSRKDPGIRHDKGADVQ